MLNQLVWGITQGLTEFLPVSSDGHLILVPAFLGIDQPDLATTAFLHLGTLVAVLTYFRREMIRMLGFRTDTDARRLLFALIVGTIPAGVAGLALDAVIEDLYDQLGLVGMLLIVNGVVLLVADRLLGGRRQAEEAGTADALVVGLAQVAALLPGVSRSGTTIAAGLSRKFSRVEAVRFSFLLGIPAIAGAVTFEGLKLIREGGLHPEHAVGVLASGITGYVAIDLLLRLVGRTGLRPFSVYCLLAGTAAIVRF